MSSLAYLWSALCIRNLHLFKIQILFLVSFIIDFNVNTTILLKMNHFQTDQGHCGDKKWGFATSDKCQTFHIITSCPQTWLKMTLFMSHGP